jgi:3-dehydroquinate synthase
MIHETMEVSLGNRSYPIRIGRGLEAELAGQVGTDRAEGRRLAVITDNAVARAQRDFIRHAFGDLPMLVLPAGETSKGFKYLEQCCQFLGEVGLDRDGRIFAVGGGVVGDLAGFAAASFYRGIGFYQVPTTLLAMVDSSVGGKTGINLRAGKNLVGAFHQPLGVFADVDTLLTLPRREFSAGMAEVIKHGLIADAELFEELERGPVLEAGSNEMPAVIRRNCAIKAAVVSADEREQSRSGGRALLNLGHTFGHAIEAAAGYGNLLHGEAVAIGLVLAARLSENLDHLDAGVAERVVTLVSRYGLPVRLPRALPLEALMEAALRDKKARLGRMRYVALERIGKAITVENVPSDLVAGLFLDAGAEE